MLRPVARLVCLLVAYCLVVAGSCLAAPSAASIAEPADMPRDGAQSQAASLLDFDETLRWLELCSGPLSIPLLDNKLCTHGPDPAPAGYDAALPVLPLPNEDAHDALETVVCDGDGESGPRIQVLYVYRAGAENRLDRVRLSLQAWAAEADRIVQASAAATGGERALRFVHDDQCQPVVRAVEVPAAAVGGFDATITALKRAGHNRPNRSYLAFVDSTSAGICGIATVWADDRPGGGNRNNTGPAYARVDAGCWDGFTAAHEVMHNLGAVQHSAPNASGGFHCVDEWDVMCYADAPRTSTRVECPNRADDLSRFDCNNDDYFHAAPPRSGYLAHHWNAANNRLLIGATSQSDDDKDKKDKKKRKRGKGGKGGRR